MLKEFREFLMRGNVVDLAVAVIIGGAFGKIISSLVDDVLMPLIGLATAGVDMRDWSVMLKPAVMDGSTVVSSEVVLNYGVFLQNVIDFVIIGFCIFIIIKIANKAQKAFSKEQEVKDAEVNKQEVLLTEIRDLLKKDN
ncbi:MAG: large-conductance mechanosensitive channel protein MscL [Bacillota bacterium]|jgi:large conductance mechanosensitive channel